MEGPRLRGPFTAYFFSALPRVERGLKLDVIVVGLVVSGGNEGQGPRSLPNRTKEEDSKEVSE